MRTLQVRWWGHMAAAALLASSFAFGQQTGGQGGSQTPTTGGGNTGGSNTGGRGGGTTTPTNPNSTPPAPQRTLFISGNVTLPDGSPPPERVLIERRCSTNTVRSEGYTDSKGRFSFQLGAGLNTQVADASTDIFLDPSARGGQSQFDRNPVLEASGNPATELVYWDCELQARLPGFRSDSISLAGKRYMDNPDVGTIILHPLAKVDGLTESITSAAAPKDARKAYEKGVQEFGKEKFDKAEKELRKAVDLHPKYAAAWLQLGRTLEKTARPQEARQAYLTAVESDANYILPQVALYELAFKEGKLEEVAARTDTVLRLNPYEFPMAYYFNGVANLQLKHLEAAETSARKAVEADTRGRNPKTHYLLGMVLVQTREYAAARESFQSFLKAAPDDPQRAQVEDIIGQIDRAIGPAGQATAP